MSLLGRSLGVLICGVALTAAVRARGEQRVYGEGLQSCGQWVRTIGAPPDDLAQRTHRLTLTAWIRGFLTATDIARAGEMRAIDSAAIEMFVDDYCIAHPQAPISHVALALVVELIKP